MGERVNSIQDHKVRRFEVAPPERGRDDYLDYELNIE